MTLTTDLLNKLNNAYTMGSYKIKLKNIFFTFTFENWLVGQMRKVQRKLGLLRLVWMQSLLYHRRPQQNVETLSQLRQLLLFVRPFLWDFLRWGKTATLACQRTFSFHSSSSIRDGLPTPEQTLPLTCASVHSKSLGEWKASALPHRAVGSTRIPLAGWSRCPELPLKRFLCSLASAPDWTHQSPPLPSALCPRPGFPGSGGLLCSLAPGPLSPSSKPWMCLHITIHFLSILYCQICIRGM